MNKVPKVQLKKGIYILPSLFTTGNVFCGFYAFITVLNNQYFMAAVAIVVAIIFDCLDGRVARLTKTTSAFGVQYDSLADVISFGMAPALLAYAWVLKPFGRLGWMAAFLFLLCGALRLARFNVTKPDTTGDHFIGLPIPAAAAVIASIIIAFEDLFATRLNPMIMVGVVYLLAFLMVSNIKYPAFKKFQFKKRVTFTRFLFIILFIYALATIPRVALFSLSFAYALSGPVLFTIALFKNKDSSKLREPLTK
ncbi:MAG: CDP-diacylglycerol--serine O-phosphatidyltransferase [Nitrospinaceae bacterium]|nr:CDP-diacylglycerol--serine O-phosphatidyltransferase [Nitrospinaceae bacterium]NIR56201.1 CDP-diacylglycerol--serine O-phosphatidyltransferase [Nitrospinaceae bacterium]NIS86657.1 CDP-diacylglycerol--serine O-phosphatidyltransferase [Nitrospinaceae bacterium]NIT83490.1 CDP-diacylglycerol--serine O-phosphatidyltransferase [Nitrospinaceae bacterium]NIU45695.1 CDP-diacylglycerol--serine O-phosphatidyltransferase [Nitrospinaceae bacterium]